MNDFIDKRKQNPRRENLSPKFRFEILRRDGFTCQYCGRTGTEKELEVDHIVPFSKSGTNDASNLITTCRDCNRAKSDSGMFISNGSKTLYPFDIDNPLFNTKPVLALFQIKTNKIAIKSHIAEKIKTTYSHTCDIFKKLESCDLIVPVIDYGDKRSKHYTTTDRGEMVTLKLLEIVKLMEND